MWAFSTTRFTSDTDDVALADELALSHGHDEQVSIYRYVIAMIDVNCFT